MSKQCTAKLESEWITAETQKDFKLLGKILRAEINLLKSSDGLLRDHKESIAKKVSFLENSLGSMDCEVSLLVINHIRYARKTLSISSGSFGSAFESGISAKERAKIRKRNKPPVLGIQTRKKLGAEFPIGHPRDVLQPSVLGNGDEGLA